MARKPHPWYRSERNQWWVRFRGKDHCLGDHPLNAPRPEKSKKTGQWNAPREIEEAFFKLMGGTLQSRLAPDAVITVLDEFLTWCKKNRAASTANRYEELIQDFVKADYHGIKCGA